MGGGGKGYLSEAGRSVREEKKKNKEKKTRVGQECSKKEKHTARKEEGPLGLHKKKERSSKEGTIFPAN